MPQVDLTTTHAVVRVGDGTAAIGIAAGLLGMIANSGDAPEAIDYNLGILAQYADRAANVATDLVEQISQARLANELAQRE
mgnify:CR=1 FL=1